MPTSKPSHPCRSLGSEPTWHATQDGARSEPIPRGMPRRPAGARTCQSAQVRSLNVVFWCLVKGQANIKKKKAKHIENKKRKEKEKKKKKQNARLFCLLLDLFLLQNNKKKKTKEKEQK
jgi:hypothetical protein